MNRYDFSVLIPYLHLLGAALFDLDGTLIINNEDLAHNNITKQIYEEAAEQFGKHGVPLCEYDVTPTHKMAGTPINEIIRQYSDYLGVEIPHEPVVQRIMQHRKMMPTQDESVEVLPVFQALLSFFQAYKVPRLIVTSSEPDRAHRYVDRGNLAGYFSDFSPYIFTGHKPQPDPYLKAWIHLRNIGHSHIERGNCVGFEDTPSGVKACKAAGKVAIAHTLASHVVNKRKLAKKLEEAGADYIINSPDEFPRVLLEAVRNLPQMANSDCTHSCVRANENVRPFGERLYQAHAATRLVLALKPR
ncbi:MAG: HAD family phosphatase [Alphaproteobacteria bacterium]|nr:HAD family phosphatase [Alphaproteobacteria bacterium]